MLLYHHQQYHPSVPLWPPPPLPTTSPQTTVIGTPQVVPQRHLPRINQSNGPPDYRPSIQILTNLHPSISRFSGKISMPRTARLTHGHRTYCTSDAWSQKITSDAWFWNLVPDAWFQNVTSGWCLAGVRHNVLKSHVRCNILKPF